MKNYGRGIPEGRMPSLTMLPGELKATTKGALALKNEHLLRGGSNKWVWTQRAYRGGGGLRKKYLSQKLLASRDHERGKR